MANSLILEPPDPSNLPLNTRRANLQDAKSIHLLIHSFTHDGTLLPRTYREICANIHTFTVVETAEGRFIGSASLHIYGPHLAEVRSIVVRPDAAHHGAGSLLVQSLLHQAAQTGIACVCLFTRIPAFFQHFQFRVVERQNLRDKVQKDCQHCSRRNSCDETAMIIGELPATLSPASIGLIHNRQQGGLIQLQL
jgi:amino-acid N-acetyltransferase